MLDAVSTNKTEFFRETFHFDYLVSTVLPEFEGRLEANAEKQLRVWSAGCSSGEEPYSLAMVLSEYSEKNPRLSFSILATDMSTRMLEKATNGVYDENDIQRIPAAFKGKYFIKGKNRNEKLVRVVSKLRRAVIFRRLNFMEKDFAISIPMHVIFCRNVMMYFDLDSQQNLVRNLHDLLVPGGCLFTGETELLSVHRHQFETIQYYDSIIYRKKTGEFEQVKDDSNE